MITMRRLLKSSASESSFPVSIVREQKANHLILYRSTEYAIIVSESENIIKKKTIAYYVL